MRAERNSRKNTPMLFPISEKRIKQIMFAATMLAPVGIFSIIIEARIPARKHTTETMPETSTTLLKVLQIRIAVSDGKITRLDMSRILHKIDLT